MLAAFGAGHHSLSLSESQAFVAALLQQPLARHTERTVVERAALRRELAAVRRRGWARSRAEFRAGSCSVAVPVGDGPEPVAAVGVVAYELRDDLDRCVPALPEALRAGARRTSGRTRRRPWTRPPPTTASASWPASCSPSTPRPPVLVRHAETLLRRKVLFGSDFPLLTPDRWLREFAELPLRDEVRPLILKENAMRVLGLGSRERA